MYDLAIHCEGGSRRKHAPVFEGISVIYYIKGLIKNKLILVFVNTIQIDNIRYLKYFLQKIIEVTGPPVAYLKDGGTDLAKAVRTLTERGYPSLAIDDISHIIANLLKHEYEKHPMFVLFVSACGQASKKLKKTFLACFAPPKVSTKARFMNIHRLVKWADLILKHSPKGRASKKSVLEKLRKCIDQLPECKLFISRFIRDATPLLNVKTD